MISKRILILTSLAATAGIAVVNKPSAAPSQPVKQSEQVRFTEGLPARRIRIRPSVRVAINDDNDQTDYDRYLQYLEQTRRIRGVPPREYGQYLQRRGRQRWDRRSK